MPFVVDNAPVKKTGFIPDQQSVGGFAGNVVKSGARFVGDTAGALINVVNPDLNKNTIANIAKLGASVVSLVLPGEQGNEDLARKVGQFYADRYGSLDKAWNSLYNDPVGVAADASVVLGGAGLALKGLGTASKVSGLARAGELASTAGRIADPLNVASKLELAGKIPVASRLMSKAPDLFRKVGTGIEKAGEELPTKGLGNPAKQADLARRSGKTVGAFIDEKNLWDRTPESASKVKNAIGSQYDTLAMDSTKKVPTQKIFDLFDEEINKLQNGAGAFSDTNASAVAELQRRKLLLQAHLSQGGNIPSEVGINQITDFRRNAVDPDVPKSMFNLDAKGSGAAQGVKKTRDILKSTIDSSDPALAGLGSDYGMAKGVEDVFRKSSSRANNRQLVSLSKLGSAGVGGALAGIPGAAAGMVVEQVSKSPQFLKTASKTMKAVGGAIKNSELPKVPSYVSTGYQVAKATRMLNPTNGSTPLTPPLPKPGVPSTPSTSTKTAIQPSVKDSALPSVAPTAALKVKYKGISSSNNPFSKVKKVAKGSFY